jgi:hypothetical protein
MAWRRQMLYDDGRLMPPKEPDTPAAPTEQADASAAPRNALGLTWTEYEHYLRDALASLGSTEIERELRIQKRIFARHSRPNPVAEERNRLLEQAYQAVPPAQRRHFLEVAKKTWT